MTVMPADTQKNDDTTVTLNQSEYELLMKQLQRASMTSSSDQNEGIKSLCIKIYDANNTKAKFKPPTTKKWWDVSVELDVNEAFLRPTEKRESLLPLMYPEQFNLYEKQRDFRWTPSAGDVDMSNDLRDYREIVTHEPEVENILFPVLAFFNIADIIVGENLSINFTAEVTVPEFNFFYAEQAAMEAIHAHQYALLIDTYVEDLRKKSDILNATQTMPAVRAKAEWVRKWMDPQLPFEERLVAFSAIEGVFFISSFAAIYKLKNKYRGKLNGLTKSNEWISRDENLHVEFAISLHNILPRKVPLEKIIEIYMSAMEVELGFVDSMFKGVKVSGFSKKDMREHVRATVNLWVEQFQKGRSSPVTACMNPDGSRPEFVPEFGAISLFVKHLFFETRATYQVSNCHEQSCDPADDF